MVKIYNFDIEVKGQDHTEVMNVCDIQDHDDTLIVLLCQRTKKL